MAVPNMACLPCLLLLHLLSLYFSFSISAETNSRSVVQTVALPSRSIYDLVQVRRAAARLAARQNQTRRFDNNTDTNSSKIRTDSSLHTDIDLANAKEKPKLKTKPLVDRLIVMIIFIATIVLIAICVVVGCIVVRYIHSKNPQATERPELREPLSSKSRRTTRYSWSSYPDTRNFTRKKRNLSTATDV